MTIVNLKPTPEFEESSQERFLVPHNLSDSSEFLVIQNPVHQNPELDGQALYVDIGPHGKLGSFKDSAGKVFDLLGCGSKEQNFIVFSASPADDDIVGDVSGRVSLGHCTRPEEYGELSSRKKLLGGASISVPFTGSTQKSRKKSALSGRTTTTPSSSIYHPQGKSGGSSGRSTVDTAGTGENSHSQSHARKHRKRAKRE